MNKILFNFILGIIVAVNMLFFPVQAEEVPISDAQTVVGDLHDEESSDDPVEESVIENDSEAAAENVTIDEGLSSDETENEAGTGDLTEEETGIGDAIALEEESGTKDGTEEEAETGDTTDEETGNGYSIQEGTENGDTTEEDLTADDADEEAVDGEGNETEEVQQEDPAAGVTEMIPDDPENTSAGTTDMLINEPEALTETQAPADDSGVNEKPENVDPAPPARVYARPVINNISTDGKSIKLEWDNAEGALFQIYRWNLFPYMIGTSSTSSFVDTDVVYGRSYTYFIATNSDAYRYPYSQTVSKWVRRPIEDIDAEHRIGENQAWDLDGNKKRDSLVISGSGSMPDFSSSAESPWHDRAGEIRHISIDDGVTYVGDHSFSEMEALQEVSLPSTVREYGREVFRGSTNLEFFNHDSAVDSDQLHIAVQYLMGVYSGAAFEPEVYVRKGAEGEDFDGMPALIRDRDYTVTYNNTKEAGDGTIEITFIGDYADAGSVVIPFTVVSELRNGEKIKNVTGIELLPSSSTYTGAAQHPDMIVRSGRWILKEGVDFILACTDMVDAGTYTVTAQGIGAYSGKAQAFYTILKQRQSADPKPPVKPSVPAKNQNSDPVSSASNEKVKKTSEPKEEKTKIEEDAEAVAEPEKTEDAEAIAEPGKTEAAETAAKPENKEAAEAASESEKVKDADPVVEPEKKSDSSASDSESYIQDDLFRKGESSLGKKDVENVRLFAGAVGIVVTICIGVYIWFFHWFLHAM